MEIEENNVETTEDLAENDVDSQPAKKARKFHAKEFRDNLKTTNGLASIKEFVHLCTEEQTKQDYALQFIEQGGSLTEILRFLDTFEKKNAKEALPVFQAFNIVLLKILSKRPDKLLSCEEICREFLVKYYPFIKSMLSLNSTSKQRKVALKILSTMTTMSAILAKDVLAYASFDQAVLEILVNPGMGDEQSSVRTGFIHFLLSFLVEGNTPIITTFLEKKGLLTSIFPGLLYDKYETIELVLSTIKEKILEDRRLTKTVKMNTFNTHVVKNLVNLYNWKGPLTRKTGNLKKRMSQPQQTDPIEKSKVCNCVHQFLLILCTSKFGVIFRDPTIGLSGKMHNNLMLTVLQGLGKPWDHHLASELVTKICLVCPDLVKPVLNEVTPFLEPRVSKKWLNATRFVQNIIENLTPEYLGQYFEKLNVKQINTIIQTLFVPKNVVEIISQNLNHEYLTVKHKLLNLLFKMVETVSSYIDFVDAQTYFTQSDKTKLKELISVYLEQNLPPLNTLMQVWNETSRSDIVEDPDLPFPDPTSNLSLILDILYEYYNVCPPLVEDLTNQINTLLFLQKIQGFEKENNTLCDEMFVKSINLFLLCDFAAFLPTTEIFDHALPLLLKIYIQSETKSKIEKTLYELLKNTGIFDGCFSEIKIWIYSFLELQTFDESVAQFFMNTIKLTYTNYTEYCKEISDYRQNIPGENILNYKSLIETLRMDIYGQSNYDLNSCHNILSPLIVGLLNSSFEGENVKDFVNVALTHLLHSQTAPQVLFTIMSDEKYFQNVNKPLNKYFNKWCACDSLISLKKVYQYKNSMTKLSKYLVDTTVESFENFSELHEYQLILATKMIIFYVTQLSKTKTLEEQVQNKYLNLIFELIKNKNLEILDVILKNPVLIQLFSPIRKDDPVQNLTTDFIIKIIEKLTETLPKDKLETYLNYYRSILIRQLYVMLERSKKNKKAPKNNNFISTVQLFELNAEQCAEMIKLCSNLPSETLVTSENTISGVVELISYCLNRNLELYSSNRSSKFIDDASIKSLGQQLLFLNTFGVEMNFELLEISIFNYLQQFPHLFETVDEDIFKSLLLKNNVTKYTCRLAMLCLRCNKTFFKTILDYLDGIIDKRELIFSLLYATIDLELPDVENFFQKVYSKHEQVILKVLNKPQKVAQYLVEYYQVLIKIVQNYVSDGVCKDFCSKFQKFDVSETFHFEIITALFQRSLKINDNKNKIMSNYIGTTMGYVLNVLKKQEHNDEDNKKLENILKHFCNFLNKKDFEYTDGNLVTNATFQSFSKSCLKFGLQGNPFLVETLRYLSEFCPDNVEYLGMLFEMAVSHSETLNIILDSANPTKPFLIQLLYTLCKKYPSVMTKNHIPVWLGAYEGSLSISDQYLLKLMALYEQADIGFNEFKPYLWGKVAVGHYSVKFGVEMSLWRQPKPSEVLDIFDLEKIKFTITNFPKSRKLNPDQSFYNKSMLDVYDPAFYLPLLSQLLAPESTIKWYQCKFGAIALVIIALTSDDKEVRTAACHVLARFHAHLEAARYGKDRLLWLHFIEALCRGASTLENLHISTIAGIFMARCALIFNRPDHSLYTALTKYIMAKECPDLTYVPELLELLHSTDVKFIEHRNFILEVMRDGLKDDNDLKIMFRSMALKFLMDIYNSVVMNHEGKRLILEIITSAVSISTGARILTSTHGLMSWLLTTIQNLNQNDSNLLSATINLIKKLYSALETDQNVLQYNKFSLLFCLVTMINKFDKIRILKHDIANFVYILHILYNTETKLLSRGNLEILLNTSAKYFDSHICKYYLNYGIKFVEPPKLVSDSSEDSTVYYLRLLTLKWIATNTC